MSCTFARPMDPIPGRNNDKPAKPDFIHRQMGIGTYSDLSNAPPFSFPTAPILGSSHASSRVPGGRQSPLRRLCHPPASGRHTHDSRGLRLSRNDYRSRHLHATRFPPVTASEFSDVPPGRAEPRGRRTESRGQRTEDRGRGGRRTGVGAGRRGNGRVGYAHRFCIFERGRTMENGRWRVGRGAEAGVGWAVPTNSAFSSVGGRTGGRGWRGQNEQGRF
jgi:hypothetical protein